MYQLSQREVLELADRLVTHEMIIGKLGFMVDQAQDQGLKEILRRHRLTYLQHYNEMASLLQQAEGQNWQAYGQSYPPHPHSGEGEYGSHWGYGW